MPDACMGRWALASNPVRGNTGHVVGPRRWLPLQKPLAQRRALGIGLSSGRLKRTLIGCYLLLQLILSGFGFLGRLLSLSTQSRQVRRRAGWRYRYGGRTRPVESRLLSKGGDKAAVRVSSEAAKVSPAD